MPAIRAKTTISDQDRLALLMLKRGQDPNRELSSERRDRDTDERKTGPLVGIPGETKIVPVTTTTVEGIGRVEYGTITFQVTSATFPATIRGLYGDNPGFLITNE